MGSQFTAWSKETLFSNNVIYLEHLNFLSELQQNVDQIFSKENIVPPGIALIGIGGVILGTILLITATILYSIVNVIREKNN